MKNSILIVFLVFPLLLHAQLGSDSIPNVAIAPVEVKTYFTNQKYLTHTASTKVIGKNMIEAQIPGSLISAVNTTPGVRMEERSPGSYRIAVRGSMLRSPFGVRNTKVYLDEIPFTDAGGNTYLNLVDPVAIEQISIIKGPDGSLFGPNSGGVIRLKPSGFDKVESKNALLLSSGSYNTLVQQFTHSNKVSNNYQYTIDQAFTRSDGYRDHTGINKKFIQTTHQWKYDPRAKIKFLAFYADLDYQTPGGLTKLQYLENPKQARPSTATTPGSVEQQAGIRNKTLLSGIVNEFQIGKHWQHSVTFFGSVTDFTNPFITNYEQRDERNFGARTYFSYTNDHHDNFYWEMQSGLEVQKGAYKIDNYDNAFGSPAAAQSVDQLHNGQHFYFYRVSASIIDRLTLEASVGLNFNSIKFEQKYPIVQDNKGMIHFEDTWMPRFAASYLFSPFVALRSSISKGFSPPTIAEVRSSDNKINRALQPERGTNYEIGIRTMWNNRRFIADVGIYSYKMEKAIIRQLHENAVEFFQNAGEIQQRGLEFMFMAELVPFNVDKQIRSFKISTNFTLQDYVFDHYQIGVQNYNGNRVTSIPKYIWVNTATFLFSRNIGLNLMHNYTAKIPLNDANTVFSEKYHLVQAKLDWKTELFKARTLRLFVGVDNLLDQQYSLGNDINAFGGRFFNPSAPRNYYGGLYIGF